MEPELKSTSASNLLLDEDYDYPPLQRTVSCLNLFDYKKTPGNTHDITDQVSEDPNQNDSRILSSSDEDDEDYELVITSVPTPILKSIMTSNKDRHSKHVEFLVPKFSQNVSEIQNPKQILDDLKNTSAPEDLTIHQLSQSDCEEESHFDSEDDEIEPIKVDSSDEFTDSHYTFPKNPELNNGAIEKDNLTSLPEKSDFDIEAAGHHAYMTQAFE